MESLPVEVACLVLETLEFPELTRLYYSSTTVRSYVEACVREVRSAPGIVPLNISMFVLALPNLRRVHGLFFEVGTIQDVLSIDALPQGLSKANFFCSESWLTPFLVQRIVDLIGMERFSRGHWVFCGDKKARIHRGIYEGVIVRNGAMLGPGSPEEQGSQESAGLEVAIEYISRVVMPMFVYYQAKGETVFSRNPDQGPGVITPFFRKIYNEGELGLVDPLDPRSQRVVDVILSPTWNIVHRAEVLLLLIAIQVEYVTNGTSEKLRRWAAEYPSCHECMDDVVERSLFLTFPVPLDELAELEPPIPVTAEVSAKLTQEASILGTLRNFYLANRQQVYVAGRWLQLRRPVAEIKDAFSSAGWNEEIAEELAAIFGTEAPSVRTRFPSSTFSRGFERSRS